MASLNDIPFYGAYVQRQQQNNEQDTKNLTQATGLMGLLNTMQTRQRDAQLRQSLAASGGDVEKAARAAIQSGNFEAAAKLAPLVKLAQEKALTAQIGNTDQMTPDQLDALGGRLAAGGHPGAATVMNIADKRRKAIADKATVAGMQDTPQELPAGTMVGNQRTEAAIPANEVAAFLKVAQAKGPMTAAPQAGDPMLMGGGALSPLLESQSPAIAARAKQIQAMINSGSTGDLSTIQKQIDNLTAMDARFQEARGAAADRVANRPQEPLVPIIGPDGKAVLVSRSDAVGKTPVPTGGSGGAAKYANVQQDGKGGWVGLNRETGRMEAVPAADGVAASGGSLGMRESVFINRVLLSGNEASKDLENVVKLPMTASTGLFGGRGQSTGIFNAGKETLANKMTSQEVQSYNVLATGFQRSLAAIEAAGLSATQGLAHQMDSVLFREGDTNLTKLQKLAQTRQIVEAGLESMMSNPRVPQETKDHATEIINRVKKAVPFTNSDLIDLQQAQQIKPNTTLKDVLSKTKTGTKAEDFFK